MPTKFHLVEKNNTCLVLHITKDDKYVSIHKGKSPNKDYRPLIFLTAEGAMDWAKNKGMEEFYTPEEIWVSEFVCPTCGEPLIIHWVEGADRTQSGMTERVCSCWNDECALEWRTYHTADGEFIKIERFFCG